MSDDAPWLPPDSPRSGDAGSTAPGDAVPGGGALGGAAPPATPVAAPGYAPPPRTPVSRPAPLPPGYGPPQEPASAGTAGDRARDGADGAWQQEQRRRRAGQAPGWAPPPRPGLIPLHPLSFAALLGTPFRELRRNPRPVVGTALIVQGVIMIVSLLVTGAVGLHAYDRVMMAAPPDRLAVASGAAAQFLLSLLVPAALSLVGSAFLQGVIVADVARGTLGERLSLRGLWRAAGARLGRLAAWLFVLAAGILLLVLAVAAIAAGAVLTGRPGWIAAGLSAAVVCGLGAGVLGVWLYIKLSLVPSLIVMESAGLRRAMARSWMLTGGFFWRVFGVQALIAVIVNAISEIVTLPVGLGVGVLGGILSPTDPSGTAAGGQARALLVVMYGITLLLTLLVSAVTTVVQAAAVAVLYIDLRMRKEGLDLQLTRYVEERQTGGEGLDDPYGMSAPVAGGASGPA